MATRIVNKLYGFFGELIATKKTTAKYNTHAIMLIETEFEVAEPQPKRATKNLESLIKALNKKGYTVSLTQIYCHNEFSWSCFIHDDKRSGNIYGGSERNQKTAYLAVKAAIPKYGWYELEA